MSANDNSKLQTDKYQALAAAVLETEAQAVRAMQTRIGDDFFRACTALAECRGRIVLTGIGKSGHIANKIASTMASTGSPAFYLHPAEASHGDFGMLKSEDVILLLSYSGETDEIKLLLPAVKRMQITIIVITGTPESTLGKAADICLDASIEQEACPLGLAPSASTTATLALGDALAFAVSQAKGFTSEDFARVHPGGSLGRRLLLRVKDLMHTGSEIPIVKPATTLKNALYEMSAKRLGTTLIMDNDAPVGIFTDGDLRRALDQGADVHREHIDSFMTRDFHTIHSDALAAEALEIMEKKRITAIPVLDDKRKLTGVLHIHDLLQAGI